VFNASFLHKNYIGDNYQHQIYYFQVIALYFSGKHKSMVIKIPVSSEVYYWVHQEMGGKPVQINAHNSHVIADKIYDLLTRPSRYEEYPYPKFSHVISVQVCERTVKICSFDLSDEKVFRFNQFVRQLIQDRLFLMLDVLWNIPGRQRPNITRIIAEYMDGYNLQGSGMTYDALKKAYYRYRRTRLTSTVPAIAARVA